LNDINYGALENNVKVYNLQDKITLYHGDTTDLLNNTEQDVIYIDAPWGGKKYKDSKNISLYMSNMEISDIYLKFKKKAKLFVFKVPVNYNIKLFINKVNHSNNTIKIHTYYKKEKPKFKVIIVKNM
jgi:23S rRNA G2445 N2-methylase RlmL